MDLINVPFLALAFLLESIATLWDWMYSFTLFEVPFVYIIVFMFMFCCCYRFIIGPFFNGGVSVSASDSVKMAGNAMKNSNKHNKENARKINNNIRNF